ncbi:MAG: DUF1499 domain-containing protein [Woeseiaceae bacterium]
MQKKTWAERLRGIGFGAIIAAAIAFIIAGPGHRFGLFDVGVALKISMGAALFALVAFLLSAIGLIMPTKTTLDPKTPRTLATVIASGALLFHIFGVYQTGKSVPAIHDISTDTVNPPAFVALVDDRANASNPVEYAGAETAAKQIAAYPDLATLRFENTSPSAVIGAATAVANDMGWTGIDTSPTDGRLEATDTTFWYGYKDDVVVRAARSGDGVVVDVRSKSRVGISDLGKNAARIRAFNEALSKAMN